MTEHRASYQVKEQVQTGYREIRYPDGKLAFRVDVKRQIVQIQRNGQLYHFDLTTAPTEPMDKQT